MLFNSAAFLVLFLLVYVLYWFLPVRWKHTLIIAASFVFYAWFSLPFLLLFLLLIAVNYYVSQRLLENKSRLLLGLMVGFDLSFLAFFKYFYMLAESVGVLVELFGGQSYLTNLRRNWLNDYQFQIILPLAISFYTFQIVAWVIDSYRGTITERTPFKKFCVFILFFPQFVAGPIMRATDFMGQIDRPTASVDRMLNGCLLLIMGAVKKILIADRIGLLTNPIWQDPGKYDATNLVLILPGFVARVYCDFSGYTDMARGLALLLGYDIPENFRGPLLAQSMTELWRRWHITLSTWLRDYLYIPLGGSRVSALRTSFNIVFTMAMAGLWHGSSWTMFLWGTYLGIFQVIERIMLKNEIRLLPERAPWAVGLRILWTQIIFCASSVLFAAPGMKQAVAIIKGIFTWQRGQVMLGPETLLALALLAFLLNVPQYFSGIRRWIAARTTLRYAVIPVAVLIVGLLINLYGDVSGSFIYFVF